MADLSEFESLDKQVIRLFIICAPDCQVSSATILAKPQGCYELEMGNDEHPRKIIERELGIKQEFLTNIITTIDEEMLIDYWFCRYDNPEVELNEPIQFMPILDFLGGEDVNPQHKWAVLLTLDPTTFLPLGGMPDMDEDYISVREQIAGTYHNKMLDLADHDDFDTMLLTTFLQMQKTDIVLSLTEGECAVAGHQFEVIAMKAKDAGLVSYQQDNILYVTKDMKNLSKMMGVDEDGG